MGKQAGGATIKHERLHELLAGFKAVGEQLRELVGEHDRRSEVLAHRFDSPQDEIFLGAAHPLPDCCRGSAEAQGDQLRLNATEDD
jgi:hypothetical protein